MLDENTTHYYAFGFEYKLLFRGVFHTRHIHFCPYDPVELGCEFLEAAATLCIMLLKR